MVEPIRKCGGWIPISAELLLDLDPVRYAYLAPDRNPFPRFRLFGRSRRG